MTLYNLRLIRTWNYLSLFQTFVLYFIVQSVTAAVLSGGNREEDVVIWLSPLVFCHLQTLSNIDRDQWWELDLQPKSHIFICCILWGLDMMFARLLRVHRGSTLTLSASCTGPSHSRFHLSCHVVSSGQGIQPSELRERDAFQVALCLSNCFCGC